MKIKPLLTFTEYASLDMTATLFTAITRVIAVFSVVRIWTNVGTKKSNVAWFTVVPKQYKIL